MITRVDSVLIAKAAPASFTTVDALNVGDAALFDENRKLITSEADAAKASKIYIGVAKAKVTITTPSGTSAQVANIEYSNRIDKNSRPNVVFGDYSAPVEDSIVIDLSNATIVTGHRYVVRIAYKDMYEAPGQFTHTYEAYATSETAADLIDELAKKINRHPGRRVNVSKTATALTLTAMPKDDNDGIDALVEYSTVSMDLSFYKTIPSAIVSNFPEKVPGAVITKTQGNPGKGFWKQVRDVEKRMQGYKGHKFTDAYPAVVPAMMVEEGVGYDYITIENDNLYLSNDNQYIKTTPMVTEVYIKESGNTGTIANLLEAFLLGETNAKVADLETRVEDLETA